MQYYYSTVDEIVLNHSEVTTDKNGFEYITLKFERPNKNGFDFLEMQYPDNNIIKCFGFSEDEIFELEDYAKNNEALIWEFARLGGGINA